MGGGSQTKSFYGDFFISKIFTCLTFGAFGHLEPIKSRLGEWYQVGGSPHLMYGPGPVLLSWSLSRLGLDG